MRTLHGLIICLLVFTLASCNKDDDWSPSYEMEFADIVTNSNGVGDTFVRDNGERLTITNPPTGLKADTTYRYITVFLRQAQSIQLCSSAKALSNTPHKFTNTQMVTDPVELCSIWRGSYYINLILNIKAKNGGHIVGFAEQEITEAPEGYRILHVQLYHNANSDVEAYSNKTYLSCSLKPYQDTLRSGRDSIYFSINTYDKGTTIYRLPY